MRSSWKDKEGAKEIVVDGTTALQHLGKEAKTLLILLDIPMIPSMLARGQQRSLPRERNAKARTVI